MSQETFEPALAAEEFIPIPTAEEIRERSKKKKKKKALTIIVIFVALLALCSSGGFFLYKKYAKSGNQGDPGLTKIEPVPTQRGDFENIITGKGKLEAVTSVLVNSELGGTVQTVSVVEGQKVEEGDTLFVTKNSEINDLRLNALASVSAAKEANSDANSAYSSAKKELDAAEKEVSLAQNSLNTTKASGNADEIAAGQAALDAAKVAAIGARERVSAAKTGLRASELPLENARKELAKIDRQIASATVKAPISGTVIVVSIKPGSVLSPSLGSESGTPNGAELPTSAIEIADLSSMTMRTSVSEKDVVSIQVGQVAHVTFDALPGVTAEAKVVRVAPKASAADPSNIDMGMPSTSSPAKYDVDIQLDNPDPRLRYGMTAQVSITVASEKNVLMIPASALIRDGEKSFVEVMAASGAPGKVREIIVSLSSQEKVIVLAGLKEGELVNPFPESGAAPGLQSGTEPGAAGSSSSGMTEEEIKTMEAEAPVAK